MRLGNLPQSLTYCYQAEAAAARDSENEIATAYRALGNTHVMMQNFEQVIGLYARALGGSRRRAADGHILA